MPRVMAHKGQLQEVFINLVHNAIEAMDQVGDEPADSHTRHRAQQRDTIAVTVEDTGPGPAPDKAREIFDAFVTTKPHGMGLGLAICQMIVERHELSTTPAVPRGAVFAKTASWAARTGSS